MGAWPFVRERFLDGDVGAARRLPSYVERRPSTAPAPGSHKVHLRELAELLDAAFAGL